ERRRGGRGAGAAGPGGRCQGSADRSALTFVNAPLSAALYPSGGLPVPAAGSLPMHVNSDDRVRRFGCAAGVAALALLLLQLPEGRAADPPGQLQQEQSKGSHACRAPESPHTIDRSEEDTSE